MASLYDFGSIEIQPHIDVFHIFVEPLLKIPCFAINFFSNFGFSANALLKQSYF